LTPPTPWRRGLIRAALSLFVIACSSGGASGSRALHPIPAAHGYLAAAAVADITPPLHLSLFGHGPEGRIAVGVRLRLSCQIFLIATRDDIVALVPCDLQAPSKALHQAVAKKLVEAGVPITADQLFIMATHTHAAPGHYFEAHRYSGPFSSQAPGYDERVVQFLAGRIAGGVSDAFAALAPACIGWNQKKIWGLAFNRSYVPFLANESSGEEDDPVTLAVHAERRHQDAEWTTTPGGNKDELTTSESVEVSAKAAPPAEPDRAVTGPEAAVDPRLSVLALYRRIDDAPSCTNVRLEGVLAVFGMHPTGAPNTNDLYHGDIFGFAVRVAEGLLQRRAADRTAPNDLWDQTREESADADAERVIVGLANGIEGDVSPKLNFQSIPEARKLGRTLGHAIAKLTEGIESKSEGALAHASWDLAFSNGRYGAAEDTLCEHAELGIAAAGGARDGPTRIRIVRTANAGFQPDRLSDCHLQKVPLRRGTGHSCHDFPRVGPIALVKVGDGIIATLPGEATTMTGYRIRRAIATQLAGVPTPLAVAGLTNQYFQYFATNEEYAFQHYEGASTLYGPNSERFLIRHFGCLAAALARRPHECGGADLINRPADADLDPSPVVDRWPAHEDVQSLGLDSLDVRETHRDGAVGWEMAIEGLPLAFTSNRDAFSVAVLLGNSGEVQLDDDRGASIEVREIDDDRWRIRWIPDLKESDVRCGRQYRLAVRGQVSLTSRPFSIQCRTDRKDLRR
jgi:neutral ceramidase